MKSQLYTNFVTLFFLSLTITQTESTYQILNDWKGSDLHPNNEKGWEFYTYPDPTHGSVNYGKHLDLINEVDGGKIRIDVQHNIDQGQQNRNSIRINTKETYDYGLFVIKAEHMPSGLATWPAYWLSGSETYGAWPCFGEIDIIEGVNSVKSNPKSSINACTLHTTEGCTQNGVKGIINTNCNLGQPGNCGCDRKSICPYTGCGVKFQDTTTFGDGFNSIGGGVYAMELTKDGKITIWFFPNNKVPTDIETNTPNPSSWGRNYIMADFNSCPGHFKNLKLIINTTLCGDWAGNTYDDGNGNKGMVQCNLAIRDARYKMDEAYWVINYIKVFKQKDTKVTVDNLKYLSNNIDNL